KIANLESSVHLVDVQNEVTADAQVIEYNQTTEIAVMQINVTLRQKDNTCTAAYAVYRKNDKMLEMSGNPKIVQGEDTFRAQGITLDLDTQEITLDGRVSGTVTDTKKDPEPAADAQKSADENPAEEIAEDSAETAVPVLDDDGATDGAGDE
ncbi:MAG: LPS export ABC transporter periplasmic protein LptC, partial [Treponemataceae bacterium]|nr:LPS export ABC transporter periplasmic protein LptC [Treponemataceae bacterium]